MSLYCAKHQFHRMKGPSGNILMYRSKPGSCFYGKYIVIKTTYRNILRYTYTLVMEKINRVGRKKIRHKKKSAVFFQ